MVQDGKDLSSEFQQLFLEKHCKLYKVSVVGTKSTSPEWISEKWACPLRFHLSSTKLALRRESANWIKQKALKLRDRR